MDMILNCFDFVVIVELILNLLIISLHDWKQ